MPDRTLKDKVVVVGGGAKNLGGLISKTFAEHGADVAVHYHSDLTKKDADNTVEEIKKAGRNAFAFQGDLTKPKEMTRLFDETVAQLGKVDIAVNTVGKVLKKPFTETTEADFDTMFDINSKAAYFFIQEAGKRIENGGSIITITTSLLGAFTGMYSTYAGGKSPVEHFTRAAATEFGPKGISVTNVAPGPMDTPFFYPAETEETIAYHKSQSMSGDLTKIEDIVPIVTFLATDGWWITGQTIFANGGYTTR